ncbi:MAG: baseplate J/gp47 family protein [Candidatus Pacearchaeota archaeon]
MNNIPQYIKKVLSAYDSSLDLRDGSALNDLLVNAGAAIITDLKLQQDELFKYLTLEDPESLDESTLDSFAKTHLINRITGEKARGYVRLYFASPSQVNIPAGTLFESTNGLIYKTITSYNFSEAEIRANSDLYPYYSTGDLYVEAESAGVQYDIPAGYLTKIKSTLNFTPVFINNTRTITGSTEHETNSVLYSKILNSAINKTLYTTPALKTILIEQFPTIQDVVVIGTGHEKMLRDQIYYYNISGLSRNILFERSDYYGAFGPIGSGYLYSGILIGPYYHFYPFNESVAYSNGVSYSGTIDATWITNNVPTSSFSKEHVLDQYAGLYKKDSSYALIENKIILKESFDNTDLQQLGWTKSDALVGLGNLRYHKEIEIANGMVRLGYTPVSSTEGANIVVNTNLFDQVSGLIERALAL